MSHCFFVLFSRGSLGVRMVFSSTSLVLLLATFRSLLLVSIKSLLLATFKSLLFVH